MGTVSDHLTQTVLRSYLCHDRRYVFRDRGARQPGVGARSLRGTWRSVRV